MMPRQLLPLALVVLSATRGVVAGNDCQPITWEDPPEARDVSVYAANTTVSVVAVPTDAVPQKPLKAGDINCRAWARTNDDPNYYSCKDLAERWSISTNWFFQINPTILPDCSNIRPNTRYCVHAYIEPLRSTDGRCGPKYKNATCSGTATPCCNAATWTCGNTTADCAPGTCYEEICEGDAVWSTDGTCGGRRECPSKWGDCCDMKGKCGGGPNFCNEGVCQSGKCNWPW